MLHARSLLNVARLDRRRSSDENVSDHNTCCVAVRNEDLTGLVHDLVLLQDTELHTYGGSA